MNDLQSSRRFPFRAVSTRIRSGACLAALVLLTACGATALDPGAAGNPGDVETDLETGSLYVVDPNHSGGANALVLEEMLWGRLVDVHQLQADSSVMPQVVDPVPLFVDFVIEESVRSTPGEYRLETNPITHRPRLIILARRDSTDTTETVLFDRLLLESQDALSSIEPKSDLPNEPGPFPFIARNSCLVLRFNDLLRDRDLASDTLAETVKVFAGLPPSQLLSTRIFFDRNHGASVGGEFHSTRVLVDAAISEDDLPQVPSGTANALGFPAGPTSGRPNVAIRIPTRTDPEMGQFYILSNLVGNAVDPVENEPNDPSSATFDIVRAMRAGNSDDLNNGFLEDSFRPDLLGAFAVMFDSVAEDPDGEAGLDFLVSVTFQSACEATPRLRDLFVFPLSEVVELEITQVEADAPAGGQLHAVACRAATPVTVPLEALVGLSGSMLTRYDPAFVTGGVTSECWVSFFPPPATLPATQVRTQAEVFLRFSEPMDSSSMSTVDNFMVVNGTAPMNEDPPAATDLVVGLALASPDFDSFSFQSVLPFNHVNGVAEDFHVRLRGATDLAGNALNFDWPLADFSLDPMGATLRTGGVTFRFPDDNDELGGVGPDLRGQIVFTPGENTVRPRDPRMIQFFDMNLSHPVPSLSFVSPPGLASLQPLNRLGVRMQNVWRYCDFGFDMLDETKYDLDIVGLSWAPAPNSLLSEFFEAFEMRLAHSFYLPDEACGLVHGTPPVRNTGPGGSDPAGPFAANILVDPRSPELVAHPRNLGYVVDVTQQFFSGTGQILMPYPYDPLANPGLDPPDTFTWRDTAVEGKAAPNGIGIPMLIEAEAGVLPIDPLNPPGTIDPGSYAGPGLVPTVGLPLLVEIRTFPSDTALGLNRPNVAEVGFDACCAPLGINLQAPTNAVGFRALSSGFFDGQGVPQEINPDAEVVPSGHNGGTFLNFPVDNATHIGQIAAVWKWSRAHSIWLDAGSAATWILPIVSPTSSEQPLGTEVRLEFRGADDFLDAMSETASQVASNLDAYGEFYDSTLGVNFHDGVSGWTEAISEIAGSRYVQVRFSFKNNIATEFSPTLSSVGLSYEK